MEGMAKMDDPTKRRTLTVLAGVGAMGALGVASIPAVIVANGPAFAAGDASLWVPLAKLAEVRDGIPRSFKVIADLKDGFATAKNQALGVVWLVRHGSKITAFSATCPHAGCSIDLSGDGKQFFCPCHSSSFEFDGKRVANKPNKSLRDMDQLETRLVGKEQTIEVHFQRFAPGKSAKEVLG
jgi:menaquinol-cytochrome c reductase iron-sulfur subunit